MSELFKEGNKLTTNGAEETKISEIVVGYQNVDTDDGAVNVCCANGKIILRPKFQRNYVHKDDVAWVSALIDSIVRGFHISDIYLFKVEGEDKENELYAEEAEYVVCDGQQRLTAICEFVNNKQTIIYDGKKRCIFCRFVKRRPR